MRISDCYVRILLPLIWTVVPPCGPSRTCFSESKMEVGPTVSATGAVHICVILVARPPYTAWTESSDHGTAMLCQSGWNRGFHLTVQPFLCSCRLTAGSLHMRFSMLAAAARPVFLPHQSLQSLDCQSSRVSAPLSRLPLQPPRLQCLLSCRDLVAIRAEEAV